MTPGVGTAARSRFLVDGTHLGTSEGAWLESPYLAALPELELPAVDHVVVVAPHPDDEVLGTGGLLQKLAGAGVRAEIWAVTDGEASHRGVPPDRLGRVRTAESELALGRLGLRDVPRVRLGFRDGRVAERVAELTDNLATRLGPASLCVAPWRGDGHPDHDACGRAAATASGAVGGELLEYLVWTWHWADPLGTDLPWASCRRLALDRRQTARKRWATAAFQSQVRRSGSAPGDMPVLPGPVLRRFWRPFEVYVT